MAKNYSSSVTLKNRDIPCFTFIAIDFISSALSRMTAGMPGSYNTLAFSDSSIPQSTSLESSRGPKSTSWVQSIFESIYHDFWLAHYRFKVTFGLYVMTPGEKLVFYAFCLLCLYLLGYALFNLPAWTFRFSQCLRYYVTGTDFEIPWVLPATRAVEYCSVAATQNSTTVLAFEAVPLSQRAFNAVEL